MPPRVDDLDAQRPRMGSTCETTVGRGGPCRHGGTRKRAKRASIAPHKMTQMHPFIAIRSISRVSLQLGTAGPDPACVALHFTIVGAARPLFVIGSVTVLTDGLTALYSIRAVLETTSRRSQVVRNIKQDLQHVPRPPHSAARWVDRSRELSRH